MPREERWDPRHISLLPSEVRSVLPRHEAKCGPPAAEHLFSRSIEAKSSGQSFIALHYELFRCRERETLCDTAGCLHEIFASSGGGPYRLVLRFACRKSPCMSWTADQPSNSIAERPSVAVF